MGGLAGAGGLGSDLTGRVLAGEATTSPAALCVMRWNLLSIPMSEFAAWWWERRSAVAIR